jgi:hypothetical protein
MIAYVLEALYEEEMVGVQVYVNTFYFGLVYYQLALSIPSHRRKFLSQARRRGLKKLRKLVDNPNAKPLLLVLEAEDVAASSKSSPQALIEEMLAKATPAASKGEIFCHIAALSNERASMALEGCGAFASFASHMECAIEH